MPNRSSKRESDPNRRAYLTMLRATGQEPPAPEQPAKNPAAVALGRLGGLKGGKARAQSLSAGQRKAIAKRAARERWKGKQRGK